MPYDLFITYAHRDNDRGRVRELCDAVRGAFREAAGRSDEAECVLEQMTGGLTTGRAKKRMPGASGWAGRAYS